MTPEEWTPTGSAKRAERLAQLEKVAELAHDALNSRRGLTEEDRLLDLALAELDYPGDTPGPFASETGTEAAARANWPTWSHDRTSIKEP